METPLNQMTERWKKLSAPEIVDEINRFRVLFEGEEKRLKEIAGPYKAVFNIEICYYEPLKVLFDELNSRLLAGEEIALHYNTYISPEGNEINLKDVKVIPHTVRFTSDSEGNYYFDGNKVKVVFDREFAYRLQKTQIKTSYDRPVDFYLNFLDSKSKFTPRANVFASTCRMICEKYKLKKA